MKLIKPAKSTQGNEAGGVADNKMRVRIVFKYGVTVVDHLTMQVVDTRTN